MGHARGGFRGQRMEKDWSSISASNVDMTADGTTAGGSIGFANSATILRIMGDYVIFPTIGGTFAAGDQVLINVGLGVVSSDAFAVGGGSLPDPVSDPGYPWLYWRTHAFQIFDSTPNLQGDIENVRVAFETKAMRKVKAGQTLGWMVEYADIVGAPPFTFLCGQARILLAGA